MSGLLELRTRDKLKNDAQIIGEVLKLSKMPDYHELLNILDTRYTIMKPDGYVIYDSKNHENELNMENHLYRPEIESLKSENSGFSIRVSKTLNERMAYFAAKTRDFDGRELIIRTSESYSSQIRELFTLLFIQIIFFIILDFTMLLFYKEYIERSKRKRIEKMRQFLESGVQVNEEYLSDDKWLLNFWFVVREWQARNLENIKKLKKEKILLNRLINSLDAGILLFDEKLNLITKNNSLNFLFQQRGKNYLEIIDYSEIREIIKESFNSKKDIEREVFISPLEIYLFVRVRYLTDNKQYILTLKNISQEKEMINAQKKFISNISHELKTPLTNIKGYLIALEDAPESLKENFLNIVKSNVQKLENIITDFLTISKLESKMKINLKTFSVMALKSDIEESVKRFITEKHGDVNYEISFEIIDIYSDYDKLLMILKNLVENGFIYNRSQEPHVKISISQDDSFYNFKVSDNGIGISNDKIFHIFERFYRVDEARTSNVAGTGLGLAIVKESINLLGGEIQVSSSEGEGTQFSFTIKKFI